MQKVWNCTIEWIDTGDVQEDILITNYDGVPEGYEDDEIFFYGLEVPESIGQEVEDFKVLLFELDTEQ